MDRRITRRQFLLLGLIGGLAGVAARGYGNTRDLALEKVDVRLFRLPKELDGLTIGLLTDFHVGAFTPPQLVDEAFNILENESPDCLVFTGDFVSSGLKLFNTAIGSSRPTDLKRLFDRLTRIKAPLGKYAVLGNHDFWAGKEMTRKITLGLEDAGIAILRNRALPLVADQSIFIGGVDDYWEDSYDLKKELTAVPKDKCHILLSHNPDVNEDIAVSEGNVDLVISGHTHGGQVVLPLLGAPYLPSPFGQKYRCGLVSDGKRQTYVSRGLGTFFLPIRYNCPPEVTLITLRC